MFQAPSEKLCIANGLKSERFLLSLVMELVSLFTPQMCSILQPEGNCDIPIPEKISHNDDNM